MSIFRVSTNEICVKMCHLTSLYSKLGGEGWDAPTTLFQDYRHWLLYISLHIMTRGLRVVNFFQEIFLVTIRSFSSVTSTCRGFTSLKRHWNRTFKNLFFIKTFVFCYLSLKNNTLWNSDRCNKHNSNDFNAGYWHINY